MAGKPGRSGAPGVPKTQEHRDKIAQTLKARRQTPEGLALRASIKSAARIERLRRRRERGRI